MMASLLERLETHVALGASSPGFHLSEADMIEIIKALRMQATAEGLASALRDLIADIADASKALDPYLEAHRK
jgi:hypothetical protein